MFEKVLNAPIRFFDKNKNGEIVSRIVNDGIYVSNFLTDFFLIIIKNVVLITIILVGMFIMSPILTAIVIVLFTSFFFLNCRKSAQHERRESNGTESNNTDGEIPKDD